MVDQHYGNVVTRDTNGRIDWTCPQCHIGSMVSNGERHLTVIPLYFHECSACGHAVTLSGQRYPKDPNDSA